MKAPVVAFRRRTDARGVSLIIVLIMLVVIGLTGAASIRGAISTEKVVNNLRVEAQAQQYAEAGLRFCEAQMSMPSGSRTAVVLRDQSLTPTVSITAASWQQTSTWLTTPTLVFTLNQDDVYNATNSTQAPPQRPQCLVDRVTLSNGSVSYVVTARGFSLDYSADGSGRTTSGSVVWLQSILVLN